MRLSWPASLLFLALMTLSAQAIPSMNGAAEGASDTPRAGAPAALRAFAVPSYAP